MITIQALINEDGETEIHVMGVKGQKCLDLTNEIEDLLGKTVKRIVTQEYRQEIATNYQNQKQ